jgi:glycosyltransferase involved in cell wall biosynthesis
MDSRLSPRKRLLVVLSSATGTNSAIVRGLVYRGLFAADVDWSAEYIDLHPAAAPPVAAPRGVLRRLESWGQRAVSSFARSQPHRSIEDEVLEAAAHCDVVYMIKTGGAADLQRRILALRGPRVILDINDAVWLPRYRESGWTRLEEMASIADAIICENAFVANYVRGLNPSVHVVPDCAQLEAFDRWRGQVRRDDGRIRLGWIGSPGTANSLYAIWEPLERLCVRHPQLELRIVGADVGQIPPFEKVRWYVCPNYDQEQMVKEALVMDIGLFPSFRVEDALGRGHSKATRYMAAGVVAVCENVGESAQLIQDGCNGVLAEGHQAWFEKLDWLISHPLDRERIGNEGLRTVRERYSEKVCFSILVRALNAVTSPVDASETLSEVDLVVNA